MKQTTLRQRCAAHAAVSQLEEIEKSFCGLIYGAFAKALENPGELSKRIEDFRDELFDVLYDAAAVLRHEHDRRNPTKLKLHDPIADAFTDPIDADIFTEIAPPTVSANLVGKPVPQSDRVGG